MQKRLIQLGAAATVIAAASLLFHSRASAVCDQVVWPPGSPQSLSCPGTGGHTYTRTNPPYPSPDKVTANATSSAMARIVCKRYERCVKALIDEKSHQVASCLLTRPVGASVNSRETTRDVRG